MWTACRNMTCRSSSSRLRKCRLPPAARCARAIWFAVSRKAACGRCPYAFVRRRLADPMRAIIVDQFGPPERLRVAELPSPQPGRGEVLVDVHMAPVNYVDLLVVGGTYQSLPACPFIPGKGPAGVVTALGRGVTVPRVGDRVLAMAEEGGYAELTAVGADQCYRLPPRMSFVEAASLSLVYDTAWFALRERARLAPGERVLVLGASGGVGQAAV